MVLNLEGANLSGADLENVNLEGADLQGANLQHTFLLRANLQYADLTGANLQGANFTDANNVDEAIFVIIQEHLLDYPIILIEWWKKKNSKNSQKINYKNK